VNLKGWQAVWSVATNVVFYRRVFTMADGQTVSVPQELVDKLQAADTLFAEARQIDAELADAEHVVEQAHVKLDAANEGSREAHKAASEAANEALNAVKEHFGIK